MININSHVTIVLSEFLEQMRTNVSNYQTFYLEHSRSHFLQLENYSASYNRSTVIISVSLILNIWSKYITIYEYDAIYEHKLVVNARVEITSSIFNFRVMSVSDSQNLYFIEFLKKSDELNVKFNIEDVLRTYFDFKTRVNIENWNVVIIEILSYAS
jgi:valyl-tRNA synthetase